MRIPSGKVDQRVYFNAVDPLTWAAVTGLSGFTVHRSRNGGAATAWATPTITELSAANMPGVYALLVDEDTTIDAASDSEELCIYISHDDMAAVTRTVELYRSLSTAPTADENADALLDRENAIEVGLTLRGLGRLLGAVLGGKVSGAGSGTEVFRNAVADTKDRVTATVANDGSRTAIVTDLT